MKRGISIHRNPGFRYDGMVRFRHGVEARYGWSQVLTPEFWLWFIVGTYPIAQWEDKSGWQYRPPSGFRWYGRSSRPWYAAFFEGRRTEWWSRYLSKRITR